MPFPPVLILAGGLGTRIKDLVGDLPKSMVPVNGEPFIDHQLRLLAKKGVTEVILCVGHNAQPLIDHVGGGQRYGLHVQYSPDGDKLLGTGGAVVQATGLLPPQSPFAVLYGDSYLDIDWLPVYDAYKTLGKLALITVYRNEQAIIPSNMLFMRDEIVAYNKEAPIPEMQHVDFGLSIFSQLALPYDLPFGSFDLSFIINRLIRDRQLAGFETTTRFYEVGTPDGVKDLEKYLLAGNKV